MQVNISGQHLEVTQALCDSINDKLARLERHYDKITNVQVILSVEKLQQKIEATLLQLQSELWASLLSLWASKLAKRLRSLQNSGKPEQQQ